MKIKGQYYTSSILVDEFINEGLLFSFFSMIFFFLGTISVKEKKEKLNVFENSTFFYKIYSHKIQLLVLFISFLLSIYILGGISNAFYSNIERGDWNIMLVDLGENVRKSIMVGSSLIFPLFMLYASIGLVIKAKYRFIFLLIAFVSSWIFFFEFSRGSGLIFLTLLFADFWIYKKIKTKKYLLLIFVSLYFSRVGITQRANYPNGVGSFISALISVDTLSDFFESFYKNNTDYSKKDAQKSLFYSLDALPAFTLKAYDRTVVKQNIYKEVWALLYNINPLPSFLLKPAEIGTGLSELQGVTYGITTPALAQIFFVFNFYGVAFIYLIGVVFSRFELMLINQNKFISVLIYLFLILSIVISSHSDFRAMMKILWYLLFFIFSIKLFIKLK
ncbi:hypothetical protein [Chondrinema litorale]|uniref:hypothetical protein n=1 Tax=Chondrinema litorale TaxID=2994555 RepID=UPI0025429148|nr:hypothetical protein [Chondrinema litorale]UZR95496.1 hypothetical protein OQ292_06680 [Chondrinema litorale]